MVQDYAVLFTVNVNPSRSLNKFALFFIFFMLIHFEREHTREQGREERKGERIPSRFHTVSTEPNSGLDLTNCEILT